MKFFEKIENGHQKILKISEFYTEHRQIDNIS